MPAAPARGQRAAAAIGSRPRPAAAGRPPGEHRARAAHRAAVPPRRAARAATGCRRGAMTRHAMRRGDYSPTMRRAATGGRASGPRRPIGPRLAARRTPGRVPAAAPAPPRTRRAGAGPALPTGPPSRHRPTAAPMPHPRGRAADAGQAGRWQRLARQPEHVRALEEPALSVLTVLARADRLRRRLVPMVLDEKQGTGAQANSAAAADRDARRHHHARGRPEAAHRDRGLPRQADRDRPEDARPRSTRSSSRRCSPTAGRPTSGEISTLIAELGCSQVVRGTMRSPNGATWSPAAS